MMVFYWYNQLQVQEIIMPRLWLARQKLWCYFSSAVELWVGMAQRQHWDHSPSSPRFGCQHTLKRSNVYSSAVLLGKSSEHHLRWIQQKYCRIEPKYLCLMNTSPATAESVTMGNSKDICSWPTDACWSPDYEFFCLETNLDASQISVNF